MHVRVRMCEKLRRYSRRGIIPDKAECVSWTRAKASRVRSRVVWARDSEGFPPLFTLLSRNHELLASSSRSLGEAI